MTKNKVLETINDLPQEFDLEVLIQKLIFIENVEEGLKQAELGQTVSHEQVEEQIKQWSK
jgi:predicted transcriptional regulator